VRTLLVSDFHLGAGPRHAVLEWARPRERLLAAAEGVDRLVLLGDILELLGSSPARSLPIAEPLLRDLGERIGAGGEIVFVPGNHDQLLIGHWLRARREPLAVDTAVALDASPALQRVTSWLRPAQVRVHYPGVWLAEGIWATHGHYLDRHLLPDSSYGVARGLLGRLPHDGARPDDYERAGGPSVSRLQARVPASLRAPLSEALEIARAATMPSARRRLLSPRMAPLTAPVLGFQMRRASIPALARVVHRLGIAADCVIFGHVHRLGPLADDDPSDWRGPTGTMRLFNAGSWVYEPLLLHGARPPHPYWPGGAIVLEDGAPPRGVGLLDDLDATDMHRARPRRPGRRSAAAR
jgi:calcineurin-like phosphoesterase family protein